MIPSDWEVKQLRDLAGINNESINGSYDQKEIQYIDISSIENYEIEKYEHFHLDVRPSRAQRIVKKGDIVVSTVRPYLRAFANINDSQPNLVCSTGFAVLRSKNLEDAEFIFNYIKSHHFEVNIVRHMEGMAYPAVTSSIVGDSLIPWPTDRSERIKVGLFLSKVDELTQKTDQVIEQTQKLKKGLIRNLLTKGIGHLTFRPIDAHPRVISHQIPIDWKVVKLKNLLVENLQNGITKEAALYGNGYPIVEIDALYQSDFILSQEDLRKVPLNSNELDHYYLSNNDFLINRVSKVKSGAGKLVLVKEPIKNLVFEGNLIRFKLNDELLIPEFFEYFSKSSLYFNYMQSVCKTLSLTSIDQDIISDIPVLLPPKPEQKQILDIISAFDIEIINLRKNRLFLEKLKRGLMQKLLTGKIRVKV
jgi:type I restriction enzyme, S subunit